MIAYKTRWNTFNHSKFDKIIRKRLLFILGVRARHNMINAIVTYLNECYQLRIK
jgi:hypothetical protein